VGRLYFQGLVGANFDIQHAGYTGDGSRADSGIPPAASRQLHTLTHSLSLTDVGADEKLTLAEALASFNYGVMDGVVRAVIPAAFLTHAGSYDLVLRACQGLDCPWEGASLIRDSPRRLVRDRD
jgi:hypothetical protein